MNNPEILATLATQDAERRQIKHKTQKTKKISNADLTKNRGLTRVLAKGRQFRPLIIQHFTYLVTPSGDTIVSLIATILTF